MRAGSLRRVAAVLAALVACGLLGAARARADTAFIQSVSSSSLPAAAETSESSWQFDQTACGSGGQCVVVGYDLQKASTTLHAMLMPISNGVAGPAVDVPLPANANAAETSELISVGCEGSGSCTAVGYYTLKSGPEAAMITQITDGVPATAIQVTLPANAENVNAGDLQGVSCPTAGGTCAAVGFYRTGPSSYEAMVVAINGGVAATGVAVPLPANANPTTPQAELYSVACQTSGGCTAVGQYATPNGDDVPMAVAISGGAPATAVQGPVPSAHNDTPQGTEEWLACPASGTCQALGQYQDSSNQEQLMVTPVSGGTFGTPTLVTLPNLLAPDDIQNGAISCSSASLCVDSGYYETNSSQYLDFLITITPSGATVAVVPPPAGADLSTVGLSGFYGVGCVVNGTCLSAGWFGLGTSQQQGMHVQTSASGVAGAASETPAPSAANTTAPNVTLDGVGCSTTGSCVEVGTDLDGAGRYEPFAVSEQAPLALSNPGLAAGKVGSAYQAQLSAAGAWGSYSWSISSGSLPAGLSLNAQTGVLSGTPTAAGTASFTVEATGTGSPLQTATLPLSLTIAALPPRLKLLSASTAVSGNRLKVKLACANSACKGSVKLERTVVVTVKKGKKRVRKHRTVVLGTASYSLAAAHTKTLELKLNGKGRRALVAAKRHRLRVTLVATVTGGKRVTRSETIHAVAKKKKK
ncbi:MAG TPA: Ig domain-containing protein [Solirubrobacteraceae bacterium]|nr:Ig domain-containing protein [Solirubrobacteraceae bacterium]